MTICATDDVYDAIDALTQKKEVVGKIELFGDTIKFIQNGSTTSLKVLAGWKTKRDYVIRAELADGSVWKFTFTPVSKNFNICNQQSGQLICKNGLAALFLQKMEVLQWQ